MAHSVEARLPFLDYRLVSLAFSLPGEWKLRGGWNKYLVREALKGMIAEPVRTRTDKMGFPTPSRNWWAGDWYAPMMDLLGSRALRGERCVRRGHRRNQPPASCAGADRFLGRAVPPGRVRDVARMLVAKEEPSRRKSDAARRNGSDVQTLADKDAALARIISGETSMSK